MPIFLRHAQNSLSWETAVLRDTRAQLASSSNYFKISTKCRADGTKRSSRKSVFPVKSIFSKEKERNYQWKREKKSYKQCPSRIEKNRRSKTKSTNSNETVNVYSVKVPA